MKQITIVTLDFFLAILKAFKNYTLKVFKFRQSVYNAPKKLKKQYKDISKKLEFLNTEVRIYNSRIMNINKRINEIDAAFKKLEESTKDELNNKEEIFKS